MEPSIVDPLWSGHSVFCSNCGHHLNQHETGRVPVCYYDTSNSQGQRIECNCNEFKAMEQYKK